MSLTPREYERAIQDARQAHSVRAFKCHNPECLRTHIGLLDEHGVPFAHFVVPDNWEFVVKPEGVH